ncbi:uncharacterized protein V1518DRAFT_420545 [Limtongia smithiae]|uniref:uncharacterized protein n=1 Tax=Limtongia smithiae TaxID=1125753 RepID=UPI0034CF35FD
MFPLESLTGSISNSTTAANLAYHLPIFVLAQGYFGYSNPFDLFPVTQIRSLFKLVGNNSLFTQSIHRNISFLISVLASTVLVAACLDQCEWDTDGLWTCCSRYPWLTTCWSAVSECVLDICSAVFTVANLLYNIVSDTVEVFGLEDSLRTALYVYCVMAVSTCICSIGARLVRDLVAKAWHLEPILAIINVGAFWRICTTVTIIAFFTCLHIVRVVYLALKICVQASIDSAPEEQLEAIPLFRSVSRMSPLTSVALEDSVEQYFRKQCTVDAADALSYILCCLDDRMQLDYRTEPELTETASLEQFELCLLKNLDEIMDEIDDSSLRALTRALQRHPGLYSRRYKALRQCYARILELKDMVSDKQMQQDSPDDSLHSVPHTKALLEKHGLGDLLSSFDSSATTIIAYDERVNQGSTPVVYTSS